MVHKWRVEEIGEEGRPRGKVWNDNELPLTIVECQLIDYELLETPTDINQVGASGICVRNSRGFHWSDNIFLSHRNLYAHRRTPTITTIRRPATAATRFSGPIAWWLEELHCIDPRFTTLIPCYFDYYIRVWWVVWRKWLFWKLKVVFCGGKFSCLYCQNILHSICWSWVNSYSYVMDCECITVIGAHL